MKRMAQKTGKVSIILIFAALIVLGAMGVLAIALELPPTGSVAYIQTSAPNTPLGVGDWYTNAGRGNRPHEFIIYIPCTVDPAQTFTMQLYDPEVYLSAAPVAIDEIRDDVSDEVVDNAWADVVTFTLFAPNDPVTPLTVQSYSPDPGTNDQWVNFSTFDVNTNGCGEYRLLVETGDNDDNAWRLQVTPDDADNIPGTGDEIALATFESSFQHSIEGCQSFYFFVSETPSIRLNNFDMDSNWDTFASVEYTLPDGTTVDGTASTGTVWNNGTASTRVGDVFNNPQTGWWEAEVCVTDDNQYIFEPEGLPFFFVLPPIPAMEVSKDDGRTVVSPNDILTYTLLFTNTSDPNNGGSAAINVTLTDQIPANTTYIANSCTINTHGGSCSESGGVITFVITEPVTADSSGSAQFSVQVNPDASGTVFNSVTLNYQDGFGNQYPPETATDTDTIVPANEVDLQINKTDGGVTTVPGGTVVYTLAYSNVTPTGATGVVITETVPVNTTFDAASSDPRWSCADNSPAGTPCTLLVGDMLGNTSSSVAFAITVDNPLPAGVTEITNTATIGGDQPDPTPDNNTSTDTTPIIFVDPIITKQANPDEAQTGDEIFFTITALNPASNSVAAATNVIITDALPLELDLVTYSVESTPPGLVSSTSVATDVIDTSGHPSGVTQTVASTITVNILVLDVDQTVTLRVTARVNNLASPPPVDIINVAVMSYEGATGPGSQTETTDSTARVSIPTPGSSPGPGGRDDDDDDDDDDPPPAAAAPPPAQPAAAAATLPVLFLPETGIGQPGTAAGANPMGWFVLPLTGFMMALYAWQRFK